MAARLACCGRLFCFGVDCGSRTDGLFQDRSGQATGHPDAFARNRPVVSGLHRLPDPRLMGTRCGSTRTAHGDFDRNPRSGRRIITGDHGNTGDPGLASRPGSL